MAEGRKRFFQAFADIEQGRRCEELAATLSALADGEARVKGAEEVHIHLRSCAGCRAKLREFRQIPRRVLELMPTGPALDFSVGGRAHEWIADRGNAFMEKAREAGIGLMSRGAGHGTTEVAATGGTRGTGMAVLAKVLAVCSATAVGGATCVATGIVDPGALSDAADPDPPAVQETLRPVEDPIDQSEVVQPIGPDETVETGTAAEAEQPTPAQQASKQFSFEADAGTPAASGSEFGGPAAGSGGRASSGVKGGGFGFEK
jgi:anti-sigma factor RsiW